jgi:hypothetical protein
LRHKYVIKGAGIYLCAVHRGVCILGWNVIAIALERNVIAVKMNVNLNHVMPPAQIHAITYSRNRVFASFPDLCEMKNNLLNV